MMKIRMKSVAVGLLALSATVTLAAVALSVSEVNERVAKLLAPFNNETTAATVKFTALEANAVNVLKFGVESRLSKVGNINRLALQLPNVNYVYAGPNGLPSFDAEARLEMDLLKSFSQDFLNSIAESSEDMVKSIAEDILGEYGDAAKVSQVIEIQRTPEGDVTAMDVRIDVAIDLTKLPESIPLTEAFLVSLSVKSKMDLQGGSLGLNAELNPKYKGFSEDTSGLKEVIEGLLNNDKSTYGEIEKWIETVDRFATEMVNLNPEEN